MSGHVFLLAVLMASMASVAVLGGPVVSQATPPQCCLPKQVSVVMYDLDSVNSENLTYMDMQIDYDAQKQVVLNYTMGSRTPVNKVLIDFKAGMLYSVATAYPTHCFKMPYSMPLILCVPDDAEYMGTSYLGPMGAGQMTYDAWRFKYSSGMITMTFSRDGCVPIMEGLSIPNEHVSQMYLYSGFQPSLEDPSAFDLPDSCKQ